MNVDIFLNKIIEWSKTQTNISRVYLVGSYANNTAEDNSDIDLVFIADKPDNYLNNKDWIYQFGKVEKINIENYARLQSLRVFYKESFEVEFGITDYKWDKLPLDKGTEIVLNNGYSLLYEKT